MDLGLDAKRFLDENHQAIMVTVRPDGTAHVARVSCGLVDGKLWSSGTVSRVRTKHLRANPNATLSVFAVSLVLVWRFHAPKHTPRSRGSHGQASCALAGDGDGRAAVAATPRPPPCAQSDAMKSSIGIAASVS